jgi:hypothetical protein
MKPFSRNSSTSRMPVVSRPISFSCTICPAETVRFSLHSVLGTIFACEDCVRSCDRVPDARAFPNIQIAPSHSFRYHRRIGYSLSRILLLRLHPLKCWSSASGFPHFSLKQRRCPQSALDPLIAHAAIEFTSLEFRRSRLHKPRS